MKYELKTCYSVQHLGGETMGGGLRKRGLNGEVSAPVLDGSPAASRCNVDQPA